MLPDALPQLIDTLLQLPRLDAAQLRELLQHQADPQAAAQEMVRRGLITQNQFSSLFPGAQQPPRPRKTMLVACCDGETPSDVDDDDWDLPLSDDDLALPVLSRAASAAQFESNMVSPPVAVDNEARGRESDADEPLRKLLSWAGKGVLVGTFFFGTFFAGLQLFAANSPVPPVAHQEPKEVNEEPRDVNGGDPATSVDLPDLSRMLNRRYEKVREALLNLQGENAQPAARAAALRTYYAKPKSTASLHARIRQVVLENKTEETQRLGMGDIAFQDVPEDGSIMVGLDVTYAPFFNHNIIKSVRAIYQKSDGSRYGGPVCGNPTSVGERVLAKEGYAIGGAAIRAGMGIDGMQLTFMAIGADGLNPDKSYLSKWLGGNGGADAKTYVNDGRPIVGIAGMRSKDPKSPAFCLCLVTTRVGAIDEADGQEIVQSQQQQKQLNDANQKRATVFTPPAQLRLPSGGTAQYTPSWDNWGRVGDKWFLAGNGRWYYILPNGNVYASSNGTIGTNDALLGKVANAGAVAPVAQATK